jgi:hypothetical protein
MFFDVILERGLGDFEAEAVFGVREVLRVALPQFVHDVRRALALGLGVAKRHIRDDAFELPIGRLNVVVVGVNPGQLLEPVLHHRVETLVDIVVEGVEDPTCLSHSAPP